MKHYIAATHQETFETHAMPGIERAVAAQRVCGAKAEQWISGVRQSMARGDSRAEIVKVLWVASTPR